LWSNDGCKARRRFSLAEPPTCLEVIDEARAARACRGYATPVTVFDIQSGATLFEMRGHVGGTLSLDYCAQAGTLATAGADRAVQRWDIRRRAGKAVASRHADPRSDSKPEDGLFGPITYVKHFPEGGVAVASPHAFRFVAHGDRKTRTETAHQLGGPEWTVFDAYAAVAPSHAPALAEVLYVMHGDPADDMARVTVVDPLAGSRALAHGKPAGFGWAVKLRRVPDARPSRMACAAGRAYIGFDDGSIRWYDLPASEVPAERVLAETGVLDARGTFVSRMIDPIMATSPTTTLVADRHTAALFTVFEDRVYRMPAEHPVSNLYYDGKHGWIVALNTADAQGAPQQQLRLIPDIHDPGVYDTVLLRGRLHQILGRGRGDGASVVLNVEYDTGSALVALSHPDTPLLRLEGQAPLVQFGFDDACIVVPSPSRGVIDLFNAATMRRQDAPIDYAAMRMDSVTHLAPSADGVFAVHGAKTLVHWTGPGAGGGAVLRVFDDLVGAICSPRPGRLRVALMNGSVVELEVAPSKRAERAIPVLIQHAPGAVVMACCGAELGGLTFGADGVLAPCP
jgi:hypothetical protein